MNAKEHKAVWNVDRLDPDNWLQIPDFGIKPADVDFIGFDNPILASSPGNHNLLCIVREHVKTARHFIQAETRSLSEIAADSIKLPDWSEQSTDAARYECAKRNFKATFYFSALQHAENAVRLANKATPSSLQLCYKHIRYCVSDLRNISGIGRDAEIAIKDALAARDLSQKKLLSQAGSKGASVTHQASRAFKKWILEAAPEMRGSDKDVAKALFNKLPDEFNEVSANHERYIYDTIRQNRNAN